MLRSEAIQRINDGLGFMATGNSLEATIIKRLQEAQRDLERGKTLPKFLIAEDEPLALVAGTSTVALPSDFLRIDDEVQLHYTPATSDIPVFLEKKFYTDAVLAYMQTATAAAVPKVYVMRKATIDFIYPADTDYALLWNYYRAADVLSSDIENAWLANAPEWLIGEAGMRVARDARDPDALSVFTEMRQAGRAAIFAEDLADDESGGPFVMGANL